MPGNVKEDLLLYGDSRFNENENYIMEATINYIKSTERSLFIVSLPSNVQILTYNSDLSDINIFQWKLLLEFNILNFDFSPTAQYIVFGALLLNVSLVVLFIVTIIIIEKKDGIRRAVDRR